MSKLLNQELIGQIIDIFDDFLESKGIDIPNPEKTESESPAVFYGSDYGEVQSQLEVLLSGWAKPAENYICPFVDERGKEVPAELRVDTQPGTIIARKNTDPRAPGIDVSFRPKDSFEELDMAYIENKVSPEFRVDDETGDEILMYVYGSESDEYTEKYRYEKDGKVWRVE